MKARLERPVFLGQLHEDPAVVFDGFGSEPQEEFALFHALPGDGSIVQRVARAAMQLPVVPAGGAARELTLFDEDHGKAAEGQVVGERRSRSAAADDADAQTIGLGCRGFRKAPESADHLGSIGGRGTAGKVGRRLEGRAVQGGSRVLSHFEHIE